MIRAAQWLLAGTLVASSVRFSLDLGGQAVLWYLPMLVCLCAVSLTLPRSTSSVARAPKVLIVAGAALAATVAIDREHAWPWSAAMAMSAIALPRLLSQQKLRVAAWWGLQSLGLLAAVGILLQVRGITFAVGPPINTKPNGFTEYYLQSAYFAAVGAIAAFGSAEHDRRRLLTYLRAAVCAYAVLLTGSRGAGLMLAVGIGSVSILLLRARRVGVGRLATLGLIALIGLLYSNALTPLMDRLTVGAEVDARDQLRRAGFQHFAGTMSARHPLGLGWNGFSIVTPAEFGEAVRSTHSLAFSLLLDLGWLGAAGMFLLTLMALRRCLAVAGGESARERATVAGLLLAFIAHGWSDSIQVAFGSAFVQLTVLYLGVFEPMSARMDGESATRRNAPAAGRRTEVSSARVRA